MYLVRKKKPRVKHIWLGTDSACRMWSTGGLRKNKYHLVTNLAAQDLEVCAMCQNSAANNKGKS